ncbi:hypothetical protein K9M43_04280 [Candidatus Gracilibacteria bacterium]|nr:hypothetical protein [Candidatus Gracilibacteria bacterium]
MFIRDVNFRVEFSSYAEKHFCKDFLKKYKTKAWFSTKQTINDILEKAFGFQQTKLIDLIKFSQDGDIGIFKLDFRVAGTNTSPKTSGNRVIFAVCNNTCRIEILLVYGKDHCAKNKSETQWVLEQIKQNFPEYKNYVI